MGHKIMKYTPQKLPNVDPFDVNSVDHFDDWKMLVYLGWNSGVKIH